MILPRIEQTDMPLSVKPEQIRVRRLIEAGFEGVPVRQEVAAGPPGSATSKPCLRP